MDGVSGCPACDSQNVFFSRKRRLWICEDCDHEFAAAKDPVRQMLFFSYGHDANTEIVLRLKADLEERGHRVWLDSSAIRAGDDWRRSITSGIMDADHVVSFLSRHAVRIPGVCLDELRIALCVKSSQIRSVLLEAECEVEVPPTLSGTQWLDMSDWRARHDRNPRQFEQWYKDRFLELCRVLESSESQAFAGEITSLHRNLRPKLSDSKEHFLLNQPFVGREWLAGEIDSWRECSIASRAFILFGGPGMGKSRFAAQQLHYNPAFLCGVFLEWDKGLSTAKEVTRTLAFKLATKLPDFRRLLVAGLGDNTPEELDRASEGELFNQLITYPLSQLVDGNRPRQIVLIDGLDEAGDARSNILAATLAANLDRLPAWIGFLITSRPEATVSSVFARFKPATIQPDDPRNRHDVYQYLALHLRDQLADGSDPHFTLQRISASAQGSFLYASLLVEAAQNRDFDVENPANYPPGLDSFYGLDFRRRFPHQDEWIAHRAFLEIIAAAQVAPTFLVRDVLSQDAYAINNLKRELGSLIRETPGAGASRGLTCFSFVHKSVPDWLTDPDRSGDFFVDRASGARRIATSLLDFFRSGDARVRQGEVIDDHRLAYRRQTVTHYLSLAGMWRELEDFLLDERTPLWPYWESLALFPAEWPREALLDRLWNSPERNGFLGQLQRRGDPLLTDLIGRFIARHGATALDLTLVNMYIDAVHLGGDYAAAVALCDDYLAGRHPDVILKDAQLVHLSVRRLHHSMFYLPVGPLIVEARELECQVNPSSFPDDYNELLFLLGGNLGLLSGRFEEARPWLQRSMEFARARGSHDFEKRTLRKLVDLMCLDRQYEAAIAAITPEVAPCMPVTTRYEMYLVGALGEASRHERRFADAVACYEAVERESTRRSIRGWTAHAYLGMSLLLHDMGNPGRAMDYLERSLTLYNATGQQWGQVNSAIVRLFLLQPTQGDGEWFRTEAGCLFDRARSLDYEYEASIIQGLRDGRPDPGYHLLFL